MDAHAERRFAVGPFASEDRLRRLALEPPPILASESGWETSPHAIVGAADGMWLCTSDATARDLALGLLGGEHTLITIDCWNSFSQSATVARFRIEKRSGDAVEVSHEDRRWPDLARGGVLQAVAADWLAQKVRAFALACSPPHPSKREMEQALRAKQLLELLVESEHIVLASGSTVEELVDRTHRVLFVIARNRTDAVSALRKMFASSRHVAETRGDAAQVRAALDAIRYRR
jgi:hypothetical protein